MRPRGFTLLEVVLVLTVLVAVVSLVGPALISRLAPATFERAIIQSNNAIRIAREDARRTGGLVFVYAERDHDGRTTLVARSELLESSPSFSELGSPSPPMSGVSTGSADAGRSGAGGSVFEGSDSRGSVLLTLPSRVRISGSAPEETAMPDDTGPTEARYPPFGIETGMEPPELSVFAADPESDPQSPRLLVIFLPDGTAIASGSARLADDQGRSARLVIYPTTGRALFEPAARGADSATPDADGFGDPFDTNQQPGRRSPTARPAPSPPEQSHSRSDDRHTDRPTP